MTEPRRRLTAELTSGWRTRTRRSRRATRGSGRGGSRCTPSTCLPTGTTPGWCRRTARRRSRRWTSTGRVRGAGRRRRHRGAGAGQAGEPSRWRTCGSTSRTGTSGGRDEEETADVDARPGRWRRASRRAMRRRSTASGSSASRPHLRSRSDPDADGVRRDAPGQRRQPGRLGGHAAEGDQRRPGRGDGPRRRDAGPAVRGPGRDARSRSSGRTARRSSPGWCTRAASG